MGIKGGTIDGSKVGPLNIKPEQLTKKVFIILKMKLNFCLRFGIIFF